MDYSSGLYRLSTKFFQDYPQSAFPEIMCKDTRPYTCLLIDTHDDFYICVPYRSNIQHNNAFLFSKSTSHRIRPGLDYSKILIIKNSEYLDSKTPAIVDQREYKETMHNLTTIAKEANDYVDTYINHVNGTAPIHVKQYARQYQHSTLPYFHDIMGI